MTQDVNPLGAIGNAAIADPDIGREIVRGTAQGLAKLLGEASRYPLDRIRDRVPSAMA